MHFMVQAQRGLSSHINRDFIRVNQKLNTLSKPISFLMYPNQ